MKKILTVLFFSAAFLVIPANADETASPAETGARIEKWNVVGLSGNAYQIEVLKHAQKGIFVPVYHIWRHLNFTRSENGDTLIVKSGKNELKFVKNSDRYLLNASPRNSEHAVIYRDGITYSDVNSFCAAMNSLSGLIFEPRPSAKEIRVKRATKKEAEQRPTAAAASAANATVAERNEKTATLENDGVSGIVVIDPGHGGRDPGAIGPNGVMEKEVVLAISFQIKNYLSRFAAIRVYLTREDDVFIPLNERTRFANEKNADLFISIHTNSVPNNANVGGHKMYFLGEAKDEMSISTERLENSVLALEGESQLSGLELILASLANSEFMRESQELAIMLERSKSKNIKDIRRLHTGVGQANFYVLSSAAMPAVLAETGFISNPREEKLLADEKFQKRIGESIGAAIVEFLRTYSNHSARGAR